MSNQQGPLNETSQAWNPSRMTPGRDIGGLGPPVTLIRLDLTSADPHLTQGFRRPLNPQCKRTTASNVGHFPSR